MTQRHTTKTGTTAARSAQALVACALTLALTGCVTGGALSAPETPTFRAGSPINGRAMGGQQPVTGGVVQLYAVGSGALGTAATPLITSTSVLGGTGTYPVTTNSGGYFSITGDYSCTGNPQVYLTVTYGKTITAATASHPNLALVAALGACSGLSSSTFILINEVTTVAAGYALAPFWGADYAHVAGPNATAVANAMSTAGNLVNTTTGSTPGAGLPANTAITPAGMINSLANAISSCVNSDPNANATPCNTLLGLAQNAAGTTPVETATAAANIAQSPGNNVASLFNTIPSTGAPFGSPQLSTTPQDWTLALKFTDASLTGPYGVAVDAGGNAWVTNEGGFSVTKITAAGTVASGTSGYTGGGNIAGPQGLAVDKSGNVWVANTLGGSVVELSATGTLVGSYTGAALVAPVAVAVDSGGNAWVANLNGNSMAKVTSSGSVGAAITGGRTGGSFSQPGSIAVDKSGNVWTANVGYGNVVEFSNAGAELSSTTTGVTDSNTIAPSAVAVDTTGNTPAGNVWLASMGTGAMDGFTNSGTALATASYTGGGLAAPLGVAIDGASNVWAVNGNSTAGTLTKLAYSGGSYTAATPASGLGVLNNPVGVAVDAGGNVWVANHGDNSVMEFVGLATPATTPLAATAGP